MKRIGVFDRIHDDERWKTSIKIKKYYKLLAHYFTRNIFNTNSLGSQNLNSVDARYLALFYGLSPTKLIFFILEYEENAILKDVAQPSQAMKMNRF